VTDPSRPSDLYRRVAARGVVSATLLVVLASLVVGCGGSSGDGDAATSPEAWANDLCGAATTWTNAISATAQSLQGSTPTKDGLENAADDVESATRTFADDVRELGAPDTQSGEQAKESIDRLADDLGQGADDIKNAVTDVSGLNEVLTAVSSVTATLSTLSNQVNSTVNDLEQLDTAGELKSAFENAGNCESLTNSSS
jgi:hypothetical protein